MSHNLGECPLCGAEEFVPILQARDFHYGNPGTYSLTQCVHCTLCFQNPMFSESELMAFYPKDYYSFVDRFASNQANSFPAQLKKRLLGSDNHATKDPRFSQPGRLLDVGCGSGWFMDEMKRKEWEVRGIEPSASAADVGRSKGLDIFVGSLLDAAFPPESFDYIRFNHSFEHLPNPNEVLEEVHRILSSNGKLMIGVPNQASFNARVFGQYWWHLALPVHTFAYSPRTLSGMLSAHRFKVENVIFNTEGGALRGSIQLYLNRNDSVLRDSGRFAASRTARILSHWLGYIQNRLRIADVIEVTAAKSSDH